MSHSKLKEEYPIGSNVTLVYEKEYCAEGKKDVGKSATVVGHAGGMVEIQVLNTAATWRTGCKITWTVLPRQIIRINCQRQLEFDFME
jgi:hypothetical protein